MFYKYQYVVIIICCLGVLTSCTQNDTKMQSMPAATSGRTELMPPFRYHKMIESSPGKYFDVFGWGRGKDSSGAYMILHSDSTGNRYTNTNGDLEGSIIDIFNTDMNMDGNPEILIEAKAKDTTNHINIYAYEFHGANSQKLNFPKLTDKTKKLYHGDDKLYIKEGTLIREFPVYDGKGKDAKPTGQTKILQYGLRNGEFSVKDISAADTTSVKKADIKETTTAKTVKPKEHENKSVKKNKKHHKEESHSKKKKHRHRG